MRFVIIMRVWIGQYFIVVGDWDVLWDIWRNQSHSVHALAQGAVTARRIPLGNALWQQQPNKKPVTEALLYADTVCWHSWVQKCICENYSVLHISNLIQFFITNDIIWMKWEIYVNYSIIAYFHDTTHSCWQNLMIYCDPKIIFNRRKANLPLYSI